MAIDILCAIYNNAELTVYMYVQSMPMNCIYVVPMVSITATCIIMDQRTHYIIDPCSILVPQDINS